MTTVISALNEAAQQWVPAMWLVFWQSAVLAAVVWLVTVSFRKAPPALRFWLWMLVPLRLIIMPLLTVHLPLLPPAPLHHAILDETTAARTDALSVPNASLAMPSGLGSAEVVTAMPAENHGAAEFRQFESPPFPVPKSLQMNAWLLIIWLAGALFFAARLVRSWCRVHQLVVCADSLTDVSLMKHAGQIGQRLGLRRLPRIRVTSEDISPLVIGVIQPTVLLPAILLKQASVSEMEAILSHEFAHVRRYDPLIGWFLALCETFYYFHPAFHLAKRQCMREREQACDELVLAHGWAAPAAYANMLITAAVTCRALRSRIAPTAVVAESFGDLKCRITRICSCMNPRPRLSKASIAALGLFTIAGLPGIILTARSIAESTSIPATTSRPTEDWNAAPAPVGIVVNESGQPVGGAQVLLYQVHSHWGLGNGVVETTSTSANGQFAFNRALTFESPNGTDYTEHYVLLAAHPNHALAWQKIVSGGEPDRYRLTLTTSTARKFTVTDMDDKPLSGARVWLSGAGSGKDAQEAFRTSFLVTQDLNIASATSDKEGHVIITNLPKTECSFHTTLKGYASGVPQGNRFRLTKGATVSGIVRTEDGQPINGAIVSFGANWMWQFFLAQTGEDGHFHLEDLPARGWDMGPWGKDHAADGLYQVTIRRHDAFTSKQQQVQLEPGQALEGLPIKAVPGTLLRIKVLEPETERPIRGYRVQCYSASSGRLDGYTNPDGILEGRVLPGDVSVLLVSPPADMYVLGEGMNLNRDQVKIQVHGTTQEVLLHMLSKGGKLTSLSGRLLLPDGQPAADATIHVSSPTNYLNATGDRLGVKTGKDGTFKLQRVPAGLKLSFYADSVNRQFALATQYEVAETRDQLAEPWIMQPTRLAEIVLNDESGHSQNNAQFTIRPVVGGQRFYRIEITGSTDDKGRLKVKGVVPGLEYLVTGQGWGADRRRADAPPLFEKVLRLIPGSQPVDTGNSSSRQKSTLNIRNVMDESDESVGHTIRVKMAYVGKGWPLGLAPADTPTPSCSDLRPPLVRNVPPMAEGSHRYWGELLLGQIDKPNHLRFIADEQNHSVAQVYYQSATDAEEWNAAKNQGQGGFLTHMELKLTYPGKSEHFPYSIWFYPNAYYWNTHRAAFYSACHRRGQFRLRDESYTVVLFDNKPANGDYSDDPVVIDLNHDNRVQDNERFRPGSPFSIGGSTWTIQPVEASGEEVRLERR